METKTNYDYMIESVYNVLNLVGGITDASNVEEIKFNIDECGTEIIMKFREKHVHEEEL